MGSSADVAGLGTSGPTGDRYEGVLTPGALEPVAFLHRLGSPERTRSIRGDDACVHG